MADKKQNWFARHKVLTVILGLIVLIIVITAVSSGSGDNNQTGGDGSSVENADGGSSEAAAVGQAVRDGKFEFVVKGVECGHEEVVDSEFDSVRKTAQGQYCLMTLSVKNIGNEAQYFSESDQKLLNAEGQQFSPDSEATIYYANNDDIWLAQINPGNSVEGTLVFDVPADVTVTQAQLHDSAFSGGIKVNL